MLSLKKYLNFIFKYGAMVEIPGISSIGYIGSGVGILIVVYLLWRYFWREKGRIGEENLEQGETSILEGDVRTAKKAQKDEQKQIRTLQKLFMDIWQRIRDTQRGGMSNELVESFMIILAKLDNFKKEGMSVEAAQKNFQIFYSSVNHIIDQLPIGDKKIMGWIKEIKKHESKYYEDILTEIKMDEEKKKILRLLWAQVIDEETGRGKIAAG